MTKWLIPVVLAGLIAWAAWTQLHTSKISYVNGLEAYRPMVGREYILQYDCYVFAWRDAGIGAGFPLLGVNHPGVRTSVAALPREVSRSNIGQYLDRVHLMDVIPQNTRFRIISVRREQSRLRPTVISYEIKFLDDLDRPYQRVDIRPILLPTAKPEDAPRLDETIAAPWIRR